MSPINRLESQQWMIKAYAKCRHLLSSNAPNDCWKDVDLMTVDFHRLKRELPWKWKVPQVGDLVKSVGVILAVVTIIVLLILLVCEVKWRPRSKPDCVGHHPEQKEKETPERKNKKKSFKKWMRGSCRLLFLESEAQARRHELKAKKELAVHKERSQRKLAAWTKARERNAQRKKEKQERKKRKNMIGSCQMCNKN